MPYVLRNSLNAHVMRMLVLSLAAGVFARVVQLEEDADARTSFVPLLLGKGKAFQVPRVWGSGRQKLRTMKAPVLTPSLQARHAASMMAPAEPAPDFDKLMQDLLDETLVKEEAPTSKPATDGPAPLGGEVKNEEQMAGEEKHAEEQQAEEQDEEEEEEEEPDDPERPPFSNFDIADSTLELLDKQGIRQMTPIQAQTFQLLRDGKDMLGRSRTGTGKTLAFGLPLVERLAVELKERYSGRMPRGRAPAMLVLAPTRELARQVGEVIQGLADAHGLFVALFMGGTPYPPQQRALRGGVDILVGTPGRIIDHLKNGDLNLSELRVAVLDEADEMLNMGFQEDVETILAASEREDDAVDRRQTVMFSATVPSWVKDVSRRYQRDVEMVDAVGKGQSEAATTVEHRAVLMPGSDTGRVATLADLISVYGPETRTIVFTSTKRECDELCTSAPLAPYSPQALHGDVSQAQRDVTLKRFREGYFNVLVATDVAARGIDISGVDLIVQFRMPQDPDAYVHRSGRTGRAGRDGVSLVLYTEREQRALRDLERRAQVNFLKDGPPSTATVMAAATKIVPNRLKAVQTKVREYFVEQAKEMLASEDALDNMARALAVVAGRVTLTERSLITGEEHMTTLMLEATDGTPLSRRDAMSALGRLKPQSGERYADHVGKIREAQDPMQLVFDLPAAMADDLIERLESGELSVGQFLELTQCVEVPPLRREFGGRSPGGSRGGRGRGGGGRGGRNWRGGGGGGGGGRSDGGYDRRGSDRYGGRGDRRSYSSGRRSYSNSRSPPPRGRGVSERRSAGRYGGSGGGRYEISDGY